MTTNKAMFTYHELQVMFGESGLKNLETGLITTGVTTDTRNLEEGNIFVALHGENSDGHERVNEALSKGAAAAVVSEEYYKLQNQSELPFIVVKNTLHALGKLGNFHRRRFGIPIVAIGGANGKTTTKEMTAHLLARKFNLLKTHENFNNQIGVPMMLLQLNDEHELAVLEIGTNEPGEIAILSSILEPTHGLITNIGKEHLEKLIDLDGVEMEETFLFGHLHRKNGFAFINFDDVRLKKYVSHLEGYTTYGTSEYANLKAVIELDDELHPVITFSTEERNFVARLKTSGFTTALNAMAATAVALHFGLSDEEIITGLESFEQVTLHGYGRMVVEKSNNLTIINDCYNANPESMKAALSTLKNYQTKARKIAVLGDMRELGEASAAEHISILETAADSAAQIYLFGPEMKKGLGNIPDTQKFEHFDNKNDLLSVLLGSLKGDEVILVKGSRGMKMEEVVEGLKKTS